MLINDEKPNDHPSGYGHVAQEITIAMCACTQAIKVSQKALDITPRSLIAMHSLCHRTKDIIMLQSHGVPFLTT